MPRPAELHGETRSPNLTRTSRNQKGERGRWRMRRVEAANPSLTVGAPNLVPEFSATFDTNLVMQVLKAGVSRPRRGSRMRWAKSRSAAGGGFPQDGLPRDVSRAFHCS